MYRASAMVSGLLLASTSLSCDTKARVQSQPPVTGESKIAALPPMNPSGTTVLLRQMGTHGFLMGRVEGQNSISAVPSGGDLVPESTVAAIQSFLAAPAQLTSVGILKNEFAEETRTTGRTRIECGHVLAELEGKTDGELLAIAGHPLQPREVRKVDTTPRHIELLAKSVGAVNVPPRLPPQGQQAAEMDVYEVDLDGDGTTETISIAIGEMDQSEATFEYSVLAVSSDSGAPDVVGYQKPSDPKAYDSQERTELLGIADLNADGTMEVLVLFDSDDAHYEGFAAYSWNGTLKPLMTYAWPEDDCYPDLRTWPH